MAAEGEEGKSRQHLPRLSSRAHHHRFRPPVFDRTAAHFLLCWKCENTHSSDVLERPSSLDYYTSLAGVAGLPPHNASWGLVDAAADPRISRAQRSVLLGERIFLCA
jgi:hypothetical protein